MDPMTLAALVSGLGSLGGLFFRDNSTANLLKLIRQYTNPQALSNNADYFYKQWLASPAFTGAQQNIMAGTNSMASSLAQSLSARGLTTSGIGAISNAAVPAAGAFQMAGLRAKGRADAMDQALRAAQLMLGGAGGLAAPRNIGADIYGGGLDALSKMIQLMNPRRNLEVPGAFIGPPAPAQARQVVPYGTKANDYFETLMQMPLR